jgi:hypothetical protein
MRRWWIFFFFTVQPLLLCAQATNNWITFGQQYYKVVLSQDGIYRITYQDLQNAGAPIAAIDPRLIQVFHRGREQAIYFKHEQQPADATFDPSEYLEFFGQRNDGATDRPMYNPPTSQPHSYNNLQSDTSAYFLTWNSFPVQGKRAEQFDQVNSSGIAVESAHIEERLQLFTSDYAPGETYENVIQQSSFNKGEGWTGPAICTLNLGCGDGTMDIPFSSITNTVPASALPHVSLMLVGRDKLSHRAEIYAGSSSGSLRLITTVDFPDYETQLVEADLAWSDVSAAGNLIIRVRALGVGGVRDRLSVSYVKVTFPQAFSLSALTEKLLGLQPKPGGKSYIEISGAPSGARIWDVTDPANTVIVGTHPSGALMTAIVPNTTQARKLWVGNNIRALPSSAIRRVSFRQLNTDANFLIVTHRSLMQPAISYANPVQAYAAYRAAPEGGGYDTLTVTMDQLYNQFSFGEVSTRAIYEFMRFMINEGNPQYLFLVGKGREVHAGFHRKTSFAPGEMRDLVPTAGTPASDMTFTAGMDGRPFVPAVATGRLTASTPQQVATYLNKIKEAEAAPFNELWRKKILHLSGGIRPNELVAFKGYMNGFADIARGKFLGGDVVTMSKHGVSDIEFINISQQINEGLNFVTFFGHSSSNATDIDIGYVSEPLLNYNNPGKYPAFLVNGCNAGEFFNNGTNFGEDWVMAPNKGARSFIANSSFGFDGGLRLYTELFYQVAFADSLFLGLGIGDVQKEVARRYLDIVGDSPSIFTAQVQTMVLLGDPSLRLFGQSKPDFQVSDAAIEVTSFDGKPLHALSDSLRVNVIVQNLGRTTSKRLLMQAEHTVGTVKTVYDSLFNSVLSRDTLTLVIRRNGGNFAGVNQIVITIDPQAEIEESNKANNTGTWSRELVFNGTLNLQPPDFGIVAASNVNLIFQDTDPIAGNQTYIIEIDTIDSFTSSWKQSIEVTGNHLLRKDVDLLPVDSTVYYWRTKPKLAATDQWEVSSFSRIQDSSPGWAQIRVEQMSSNSFESLILSKEDRVFEFEPTSVSVFVKTFGSEYVSPGINGSFQIDNAEYYFSPQGFNCRNNTINLVAFDRNSVVPYLGIPFTFENAFGRACGREPQLINSFLVSELLTGNSDDIIQYVDNIQERDSVVIFSMGDAGFAAWPLVVKQKLAAFGIDEATIDSFLPGEPVIILGRKGAPAGTAKIIRSSESIPEEQELQLNDGFSGSKPEGNMRSLLIGPALKWNHLTQRITGIAPTDEAKISIYGVTEAGNEELIAEDITGAIALDFLNAQEYPFMKLVYEVRDEVEMTPARLKSWIVTFDPTPDGLLVPTGDVSQASIQEGEFFITHYNFVNLTSVPFPDSLNITYKTFNRDSRVTKSSVFRAKGPGANDTVSLAAGVLSTGMVGLNDISMSVKAESTVEQFTSNNTVEVPGRLLVLADRTNPVLEVTIDGRYLVNNDYVSPSPEIRIVLRDENQHLSRNDTTGLAIFMKYACDTCERQRITFSQSDVHWIVDDNHHLSVTYTPALQPGMYTLIAEAEDLSGNKAGIVPYEVQFVVGNENFIQFMAPYPNPSSSGFHFDFQVAGSEEPNYFMLAIIDAQGKTVTNISSLELSRLNVGMNRFYWNGTDQHGSSLSNGLYFFRLTVDTTSGTFNSSGKLVIAR